MRMSPGSYSLRGRLLVALTATALLTPGASAWQQQVTASKSPSALSVEEREAADRVRVGTIRDATSALASDEMQGRGTAQSGGDKAAAYLADRFAKLKLKPLGEAGTYLQSVKFKVTQLLPETSLKIGDQALKLGDDFAVSPPYSGDKSVKGFMVYVGYGLRDDFKGVDLKSRIAVLIGGPPKNADEAAWEKAESERLIITYLFRAGIAGLIITNARSRLSYEKLAGYLTRRRVALAEELDAPEAFPPIVYVSDQSAEVVFSGSGTTYAQAKQKADRLEPASNSLKATATITLRLKKEKGVGANVAGLLEGSDPSLKEQAVVYSAHYDAFGMGADGSIYHGAADNALGVAEMIAIAEAYSGLRAPPRRSIIFLALTGEEYGLLGAEYWVRHPTWKIEKVAANLNFDGIGTEVYGPVKRIVGFGIEHSDLGAVLESVVTATGNSIAPDPMPDEKAFYRSDHYAFVKKGVPALMLLGAPEGDSAALVARAKKWLETDYHEPSDEVRSEWNWDGPATLAVVGLVVGMRVANSDAMPGWLRTSPFNQSRGTNKPPPKIQ